MAVFLMRHGETIGNRQGLILGQKDYPLAPSGISSTRQLADLVSGNGKGIIFTSPLGRARASAEIFAGRRGWQTVIVDGMTELSCGRWEGKPRKDVAPDRKFLRLTWEESPPDGESYRDAEPRVNTVIDRIRVFSDHDPVLVVGHASVNRVFLKLWLELDPLHAMTVDQDHHVIYVLGKDKEAHWFNTEGQRGNLFFARSS